MFDPTSSLITLVLGIVALAGVCAVFYHMGSEAIVTMVAKNRYVVAKGYRGNGEMLFVVDKQTHASDWGQVTIPGMQFESDLNLTEEGITVGHFLLTIEEGVLKSAKYL